MKSLLNPKLRKLGHDMAYLRTANLAYTDIMQPVPRDQWPKGADMRIFAAWRSKRFLAQCFHEREGCIRISVNRTEKDTDGRWKDGITWDELQQVKHECGYGYYTAIEIYPADKDLVNVANIRHLWILPDHMTLPCGWVNKLTQ